MRSCSPRDGRKMCSYNVAITSVDSTTSLSHIRLLGQTPGVQIAHAIFSALAVSARRPAVLNRAEAVERGLYRWMYLVKSSVTLCLRHTALSFCTEWVTVRKAISTSKRIFRAF